MINHVTLDVPRVKTDRPIPVEYGADRFGNRQIRFACNIPVHQAPVATINGVRYYVCGICVTENRVDHMPGWRYDHPASGTPIHRITGDEPWEWVKYGTEAATTVVKQWAETTAAELAATARWS